MQKLISSDVGKREAVGEKGQNQFALNKQAVTDSWLYSHFVNEKTNMSSTRSHRKAAGKKSTPHQGQHP